MWLEHDGRTPHFGRRVTEKVQKLGPHNLRTSLCGDISSRQCAHQVRTHYVRLFPNVRDTLYTSLQGPGCS